MTDSPATPTRRDLDRQLAATVARIIGSIQAQRQNNPSAASGALAMLRRAVTRAPGSVPAVWGQTIGALPPGLRGTSDQPSPDERAAHAAITLFAVHQQSQGQEMHRSGDNLGDAVRDLRRLRHADTGDVDPVLRRFQALTTAPTFDGLLYHLRGLVTLLRGAGIPLDYARLAVDLRRLQSPWELNGVRISWGRSLYSQPRTTTDGKTPDLSDEALEPSA